MSKLKDIAVKIKWRERRTSNGSMYPDKTFYVIRRHSATAGLFSFALTSLGEIKRCEERGFIPVVDMMNYPNSLLSREQVGIHNVWDDYFQQPGQFTMEDISSARNVILGRIDVPDEFPDLEDIWDSNVIALWKQYADRYLKVKESLWEEAESFYDEAFGNRRVLGVLGRGTDYTAIKPFHHPIQPDICELVAKSKEALEQWQCEAIYLATEDVQIWNAFQEAFPGIVVSFQKEHYAVENKTFLGNVLPKDTKSIYERNAAYLVSIAVLSKCHDLVAGATSGSMAALLLTKGYEHSHIFDLGLYE